MTMQMTNSKFRTPLSKFKGKILLSQIVCQSIGLPVRLKVFELSVANFISDARRVEKLISDKLFSLSAV